MGFPAHWERLQLESGRQHSTSLSSKKPSLKPQDAGPQDPQTRDSEPPETFSSMLIGHAMGDTGNNHPGAAMPNQNNVSQVLELQKPVS